MRFVTPQPFGVYPWQACVPLVDGGMSFLFQLVLHPMTQLTESVVGLNLVILVWCWVSGLINLLAPH